MTILLGVLAGAYLAAILLAGVGRASWASWVVGGLVVVGGGCGCAAAALVLSTGVGWTLSVGHWLPDTTIHLALDPLAAFFVGLVSVTALTCAIAWMGKVSGDAPQPMRSFASLVGAVVAAIGVVLAADVLSLLVAMELSSIAATLLVVGGSPGRDEGRAYLTVRHAGTLALLAAFLIAYRWSGDLSFDALRAVAATMPQASRDATFLLSVVGFGTAVGLLPFRQWFTDAHAAATPASTALLAVMSTSGLYGLMRVAFDLLGGGPGWWGYTLIGLGVVAGPLEMYAALRAQDLRRVLAHGGVASLASAVLLVGAALVFRSEGLMAVAALALVAAGYQAWSHTVAHGLLGTAMDAVSRETALSDPDRMGGLAGRMPVTGGVCLVGVLVLAGAPPFSGFISEWLAVQALLGGVERSSVLDLVLPLLTVAFGLVVGLGALAFGKAFGVVFLGRARSRAAGAAREASVPELMAGAVLGVACLLTGLVPALLVNPFARIVPWLLGPVPIDPARFASGAGFLTGVATTRVSPGLIATGLVVVMALSWRWSSSHAVRRPAGATRAWLDGRVDVVEAREFTGRSYAAPMRVVFARFYVSRSERHGDAGDRAEPAGPSGRGRQVDESLVQVYAYRPIRVAWHRVSRGLQFVHADSLWLYLASTLTVLTVLLLII